MGCTTTGRPFSCGHPVLGPKRIAYFEFSQFSYLEAFLSCEVKEHEWLGSGLGIGLKHVNHAEGGMNSVSEVFLAPPPGDPPAALDMKNSCQDQQYMSITDEDDDDDEFLDSSKKGIFGRARQIVLLVFILLFGGLVVRMMIVSSQMKDVISQPEGSEERERGNRGNITPPPAAGSGGVLGVLGEKKRNSEKVPEQIKNLNVLTAVPSAMPSKPANWNLGDNLYQLPNGGGNLPNGGANLGNNIPDSFGSGENWEKLRDSGATMPPSGSARQVLREKKNEYSGTTKSEKKQAARDKYDQVKDNLPGQYRNFTFDGRDRMDGDDGNDWENIKDKVRGKLANKKDGRDGNDAQSTTLAPSTTTQNGGQSSTASTSTTTRNGGQSSSTASTSTTTQNGGPLSSTASTTSTTTTTTTSETTTIGEGSVSFGPQPGRR
eukprot:g69333.t1